MGRRPRMRQEVARSTTTRGCGGCGAPRRLLPSLLLLLTLLMLLKRLQPPSWTAAISKERSEAPAPTASHRSGEIATDRLETVTPKPSRSPPKRVPDPQSEVALVVGNRTNAAFEACIHKEHDATEAARVAAGVANLLAQHPVACDGKAELLRILLHAAGPDIPVVASDCERLPTWREVTELYGSEPVIVGLDSCARYRHRISAEANGGVPHEPAPRVAGLFNTGTNALALTLDLNLGDTTGDNGNFKRWNMPGGKHVPAKVKYARDKPGKYTLDDLPLLLPIVLVRDPLRWMQSMCSNAYTAKWPLGKDGRCPSLVPSVEERVLEEFRDLETFEVILEGQTGERHRSLADMWTEWNLEYAATDVPRLLVRFEDLLFHAEQVTGAIADCVGLSLPKPFRYQWAKAKRSSGAADLVAALAKYGRADGRYEGLLAGDIDYASHALDTQLLRVFHYPPMAAETKGRPTTLILEGTVPALRNVTRGVAATVDALPSCLGKEELVAILLRAGLDDITEEHCAQLPTWSEVAALYGEDPVVFGLETCARYRTALASEHNNGTSLEPAPRVAGLFNTGTNAFAQTFNLNFHHMEDYKLYNVPSRKHVPARDRWLYDRRFADDFTTDELRRTLPVVLVRDPFRWMPSMCRAPYNAEWERGTDGRCPNLVPTAEERQRFQMNSTTFELTLRVREVYREHYESLATLWSEWNRLYLDSFRPRLMVRFEDTLFHPEKVMRLIQGCVGASTTEPLQYFLDATKRRRDPTGFVAALAKYGRADGRYDGFTPEEAQYLQSALDPELMAIFGYPQIPVPNAASEVV